MFEGFPFFLFTSSGINILSDLLVLKHAEWTWIHIIRILYRFYQLKMSFKSLSFKPTCSRIRIIWFNPTEEMKLVMLLLQFSFYLRIVEKKLWVGFLLIGTMKASKLENAIYCFTKHECHERYYFSANGLCMKRTVCGM